jgi:rhodanese-related sulfurtransferase
MTFQFHAFRLLLICTALLAGVGLVGCSDADAQDAVSLEFARTEHEAGRALLIDIREPSEHVTGVAQGAQLLPMRQLSTRVGEIPKNSDKPVLLICNTQSRSSSTLTSLKKAGYTNVKYVHGGMSGWVQRGWPTVKPN